jgi:signal transduction histidine kinase
MIAAAATVAMAFWVPLRGEERSHVQHVMEALGQSVDHDINDEWRSRVAAVVLLAETLSLEQRLPPRDWESRAKLFMAHYPDCIALEWTDASLTVRWVATQVADDAQQNAVQQTDAALSHMLQGLANRGDTNDALFTPPFRLWNGKTGRRLVAPVSRSERLPAFLVAVIDEGKSFEEILKDHAGQGYAIIVLDNDQEIYRMGPSNSQNERQWGQDAELRIPGTTWRIRVWPQPELLRQLQSGLPRLGLVMGSIIGLLLFTTLDFARSSYLTSRDLRLARDELELRVRDRTAELQSTNKRLEAEIHERRQTEESLRELSGRILRLKDEEQRRIGRELHDSTVQTLSALAIDLEQAQQFVPRNRSVRRLLAESAELVERATAEVRTISYLLHPPILDELGLEDAIQWYAAGFSRRSGIEVNVDLQQDLGRFAPDLELTLFRIVQESLTNIRRHSGSPTAQITLSKDADRVTMQVTDQGSGMRPENLEAIRKARAIVGVGIAGMRERVRQLGGQFEIEGDNNGTLIRVVLPINGIHPSAGRTESNDRMTAEE